MHTMCSTSLACTVKNPGNVNEFLILIFPETRDSHGVVKENTFGKSLRGCR
jgi:hypothetical protein